MDATLCTVKRSLTHTWLALAIVAMGMPEGAPAHTAPSDRHSLAMVTPASQLAWESVVRFINHSERDGHIEIHGIDDAGVRYGPVRLRIHARASVQINSRDLEVGNPDKGLADGLGDGQGNWRLEFETSLDIEPLVYVRGANGYLASMHERVDAASDGRCQHVAFFNPASNRARASRLRLINESEHDNPITIVGVDGDGERAYEPVTLTLSAHAVRTLTAEELERGARDLEGALGDGAGKWRLYVASEHPVTLVNLLVGANGHLANVSSSTVARECGAKDLLTPSIERAALRALYDATAGARWRRNANWLSEKPLDQWHGVETDSAGRVSVISMTANGLDGELPSAIGQLTGLTRLELSHNALRGAIPPEIGKLAKLRILDLSTNRLSGSVPRTLVALQRLEGLYLENNVLRYPSPQRLRSPAPTWRFAGEVPEAHRRALREEMEHARAFFSERFGVEATGFTVMVGENYEALAPMYRQVVGVELANHYHPQATYPYAWATSTANGAAAITLMYGTLDLDPLSTLKHVIAHEYFHVLQGQLAAGFTPTGNGEFAYHTDTSSRGPNWLIEGHASYADHEYTLHRPGRRPFFDRYTPYDDLTWFHLNGDLNIRDLARIEDYRTFVCTFSDNYAYPLSFAAATFLASQTEPDSYVDYWRLLGQRATWQDAFEEAFAIGADDFYEAFDRWLPSQLLAQVQLRLNLRWPDMENQPQSWRFLYLSVDWDGNPFPGRTVSTGWTGLSGLPLHMTTTYEEGRQSTGYLSLWWSDDQCVTHLLGWYAEGTLTRRREDATPVEFIGERRVLEWNLPAHPDTLPRYEQQRRNC